MRKIFFQFFLTMTSSLFFSQQVQATFLDFDDLLAVDENPYSCPYDDRPCGTRLHRQYEDKGIIFYSAWLRSEEYPPVDYKNEVAAIQEMYIEFVGELPNFVSFNVDSALHHESSFFDVYGENGDLLFVQRSNGWVQDDALNTPYIPNEFITITSEAPIKGINLWSFQNMRNGPVIDNLTFEYRQAPVSEPSGLFLGLLGALGLIMRRIRVTQR